METAKFCGNCGNPFPRTSETTSSLRKCEQGHIYSAVYQACPYCPQGTEAKREASAFETRIEEAPSFVEVPGRPVAAGTSDFATRIDAPPLPSWPSAPSLPSPPAMSDSDLATRIETPIPSEFVTRLEAPPSEMVTRVEEPISAPTYDLLAAMSEKTPPAQAQAAPVPAPAALPRTEILTEEATLSARLDLPPLVMPAPAPVPPSVLDLNWPAPLPANAPVPSAPLPPPPMMNVQEVASPVVPVTPAVPAAPPSPMPSFANIPAGGPNRSTMVMSADDLKKSLTSKGKLVGWLVSYNRNPDGEDFKLYHGYNRLGANPACDIVIEDDTVSGSHAIIVFREGRFLIKDDLSRNGTYVNGKEVTEAHPLQSYDQIRVGNTTLVFVATQKL
jgi:hypothetical protein